MQLMESERIGRRRLVALRDVLTTRYPEVDQVSLTRQLGLESDWGNPKALDSMLLFLQAVHILRADAIPDIALQVGNRAQLTDTGLLGYAVLSAPTVLQAAKITGHALNASGYIIRSKMVMTDEHCLLVYTTTAAMKAYREALLEMSIIAIWRCIQALLPDGQAAHPAFVTLSFSAPPHHHRYEELLGCKVAFDEAHTVIALPKSWMLLPILTHDSSLLASAAGEVKNILGESLRGSGIVARVKRALVEHPQACEFSLEGTARQLKLGTRTLRRHLAQAGTSFRAVCLEVRMELAREYLYHTDMPLKEIAYQLGYEFTNNFNRAYRSYYGASPEAMRQQSRARQQARTQQ